MRISEFINQTPNPEQVVFGGAFSFSRGESDDDTKKAFFTERVASITEGAKTWLPRTLNADHGVCADLYKDGIVVATLDFYYDDQSASVYTTSEGGSFGDTTLCDRVSFAEAVATADQFVA